MTPDKHQEINFYKILHKCPMSVVQELLHICIRAVIDNRRQTDDDIDVSMQMSCIDIENDISIHINIVK